MTYGAFQQAFFLQLQEVGIPLEEVRALWARWTEWTHGNRLAFSMVDPQMPLPNPEAAQAVLDRLKPRTLGAHPRSGDFAGLSLASDSRALIPRPETEGSAPGGFGNFTSRGRLLDWCSGRLYRPGGQTAPPRCPRGRLGVERGGSGTGTRKSSADRLRCGLHASGLKPFAIRSLLKRLMLSSATCPTSIPLEVLDPSVADYEPHAASTPQSRTSFIFTAESRPGPRCKWCRWLCGFGVPRRPCTGHSRTFYSGVEGARNPRRFLWKRTHAARATGLIGRYF